jgi:hypothetical protein
MICSLSRSEHESIFLVSDPSIILDIEDHVVGIATQFSSGLD